MSHPAWQDACIFQVPGMDFIPQSSALHHHTKYLSLPSPFCFESRCSLLVCRLHFCFILLVISPPFTTLHYLWQLLDMLITESDRPQFSEAHKADLASYCSDPVSPVNSIQCQNWASHTGHTLEQARKKYLKEICVHCKFHNNSGHQLPFVDSYFFWHGEVVVASQLHLSYKIKFCSFSSRRWSGHRELKSLWIYFKSSKRKNVCFLCLSCKIVGHFFLSEHKSIVSRL